MYLGVAMEIAIKALATKVFDTITRCNLGVELKPAAVVRKDEQATRCESRHAAGDELGMIALNIEHIVGLFRVRKCGRIEKNEIKQAPLGLFVARIEAWWASID
jgi:hypothetical protein